MPIIDKSIIQLKSIGRFDTFPSGKAMFYGSFIQRLGFTSGGFPQDIRLINIETDEIFTFRVKSTFLSSKQNTFIVIAKEGTYAILDYWWTQSKWYGGKTFIETIFKGADSRVRVEQLDNQIKSNRFTFDLKSNKVNYVGTWHFDTEHVYFTNEQEFLNSKIRNKFRKIDFSNVLINLPN